MQEIKKSPPWSAGLVNASILLYTLWLLLPAVQAAGRALTGAAALFLFGLGALMDTPYLKREWYWLLARAACAALMPLLLWRFAGRGGDNFIGFYAQQIMFWFPLIFCAYARRRGDSRLWRLLKPALLVAVTLTTLTTIGWLIEGMLRGGRVYAYSRSLGSAEPGREAYLRELMLRNIGGYDFVYATVISLPLTLIGVSASAGRKRAGYAALYALQLIMIVLSQYTYAMVYAAALTAVELTALIIRKASKDRVGLGASLALGLVPLLLALLLREPLVALLGSVCQKLGLTNFAFSFEQLLVALRGGTTDEASRLGYYLNALEGFKASPLTGALFGGKPMLSGHSDTLDLLSGTGLLGAALVGGMLWLMGRGCLHGLRACPYRAQLCAMAVLLICTATLGTVIYSRDIMLLTAAGCFFVCDPAPGDPAPGDPAPGDPTPGDPAPGAPTPASK